MRPVHVSSEADAGCLGVPYCKPVLGMSVTLVMTPPGTPPRLCRFREIFLRAPRREILNNISGNLDPPQSPANAAHTPEGAPTSAGRAASLVSNSTRDLGYRSVRRRRAMRHSGSFTPSHIPVQDEEYGYHFLC